MTQRFSIEGPADAGEISIQEIGDFLRRHRWRIGAWAVAVAILVVLGLALRQPRYTSSASFVPQSVDKTSALAGLAAQFGVTAAGPDPTESPAFYADLIKTREILTAVLQADYRIGTDAGPRSTTLLSALDVSGPTEGRRLDKAIKELTDRLKVEYKPRTGVISFEVVLNNAQLAQQVTERVLIEVSHFSAEKRNAKATAERKFTEGRIADLNVELRNAEDQLQAFLQRNRDYRNSPDLTFQHDRMEQHVDFLRGIFTTVSQTHERARMDEARDTPVIVVVENPNLPSRPDGRGLIKFGALALVLGGLLGIALGFLRDVAAKQPTVDAGEATRMPPMVGRV
jgi:uncharacterized protein involved in exopolysaccharide biosynthesis